MIPEIFEEMCGQVNLIYYICVSLGDAVIIFRLVFTGLYSSDRRKQRRFLQLENCFMTKRELQILKMCKDLQKLF